MTVKAIPEGFHTITPTLVLKGASEAIKLYEQAFGAKVDYILNEPDGKVAHSCLTIGGSKLFLCDVNPQAGCAEQSISNFYLYVDNVDTKFTQAKKAGLSELVPVQEMFWGDKMGSLMDKFGIRWTIATHVKEVSQDEIAEAARKMGQAA